MCLCRPKIITRQTAVIHHYHCHIQSNSTGHFFNLLRIQLRNKISTFIIIIIIPFWLPLEHGASMKLPVSLKFLNLGQSVGLLGRVISSSQDL
jgi:hypothetical protein